ncbi:lactoylglutathione lyase [Halodesulfurarchaeum formicicum]|uniref:Lactoylglutathione lyase n=1 Tax=Halodesulfurarchaeum formicicum TaxID=1873524 RepID=A0A1D8S489_9EURY|nr:VOC family protein [Halodesulfurarchaeum formicicum]AOW80172.1 lactoylglutathione lyase [Halodesulfurarchaeum formicicum]
MDAIAMDHVNLRIPAAGRDRAVEFYGEKLGFEIELEDAFDAGDRPFFAVRLTPQSVLHLWPDPEFEPPQKQNFDHVAIHLDASIEAIREDLAAAGVESVDDREVFGAMGTARSVYVQDPFGYLVELKARHSSVSDG